MTDTAALANEVEATLENALESIAADPSLVAAAQETLVSAEDAIGRMRDSLAAAAAQLRAQAAGREAAVADAEDGGAAHRSAHAAEVATELRQIADRLEEHGAWQNVDRLVHELVGDLLVGALALAHRGSSPALVARAAAVGVLAANDVLWPGAGARLGCAYAHDGLLALVRVHAARAAA